MTSVISDFRINSMKCFMKIVKASCRAGTLLYLRMMHATTRVKSLTWQDWHLSSLIRHTVDAFHTWCLHDIGTSSATRAVDDVLLYIVVNIPITKYSCLGVNYVPRTRTYCTFNFQLTLNPTRSPDQIKIGMELVSVINFIIGPDQQIREEAVWIGEVWRLVWPSHLGTQIVDMTKTRTRLCSDCIL